jgi:hypothetical protein
VVCGPWLVKMDVAQEVRGAQQSSSFSLLLRQRRSGRRDAEYLILSLWLPRLCGALSNQMDEGVPATIPDMAHSPLRATDGHMLLH